MPITFISELSQSNNGTGLGSYIPNLGGFTPIAGDLLYAMCLYDSGVSSSYTDSSGVMPWTLLHSGVIGGLGYSLWTRTATGSDAAASGTQGNWFTSASSHSLFCAIILVHGGVLVDEGLSTGSASVNIVAPSITGSSGGSLLCFFGGQVGAVSSVTLPGGLTGGGSGISATGSFFSQVDTEWNYGAKTLSSGGATSSQTATSSAACASIGWALSFSLPVSVPTTGWIGGLYYGHLGAEARVTQVYGEVMLVPISEARVTQLYAEVMMVPNVEARVTQVYAEVMLAPKVEVRTTQVYAEVMIQL